MGYLDINKHDAANLEFVLNKEFIRSNRTGSYASTTAIRCNTRKYHGLLVCQQPQLDNDSHVLLSTVDETIEQFNEAFNLAVHRYKGGIFYPKGHKYLREISFDPMPKVSYNIGGVVFTKEFLFLHGKEGIIIKYKLEDANYDTKLHIKPLLAYRNVHQLSKENNDVDTSYQEIDCGIQLCMYHGYAPLYIQTSKKAIYKHQPHWNKDLEYNEELKRGYEGLEDLYVPGNFELSLKKGDDVYLYIGTEALEKANVHLKKLFDTERKRRVPRDGYEKCLRNSAHQFFVKKDNHYSIVAGFPWHRPHNRDTFIALPGLTLTGKDEEFFEKVIQTSIAEKTEITEFDTPLWLFWTLQMYAKHLGNYEEIWKKYGKKLQSILNAYRKGGFLNVKMHDNALLSGGVHGKAITWMNVVAEGVAVTPRIGYPVEVNALWYNAVKFALKLAEKSGDKKFVKEWKEIAEMLPASFKEMFWHKEKGYLADYVSEEGKKDWTVRPNQVIAVGLPYCPLSTKIRQLVLEKAKKELLTPRGLRTLVPDSPDYKRKYKGNAYQRELATHQGTIAVWLLQFYAAGYLDVYGKQCKSHIESIYAEFENALMDRCVGSIGEYYDADPPHYTRGAISQATSVAALLWIQNELKSLNLKSKI